MPELKADLHIHTCEDVVDYHLIRYSTEDVIAHARQEGFQVIAVTNHLRPTVTAEQVARARDQGLLLLAGVEAQIRARHVLVIGPEGRLIPPKTFDDLRAMRRDGYLVIAPHPFYPSPFALRGLLPRHLDAFDAVEYCHFYSRVLNPNRRAVALAWEHDLPLVGRGTPFRWCPHMPAWQLGKTYSLIESEPSAEAVIAAVKAGRVRVVSQPLALPVYLQVLFGKVVSDVFWNIPYYFLFGRPRKREGEHHSDGEGEGGHHSDGVPII
jgi:hypothetical protein